MFKDVVFENVKWYNLFIKVFKYFTYLLKFSSKYNNITNSLILHIFQNFQISDILIKKPGIKK